MKAAEMAIPHLFTCPISLELFQDPVTLCTGQTYDRSSIEKWLAAGNLTCPVTMQKLHDKSMVPNHTLRHLIEEWLQICHQLDTDYFKLIDHDHSLANLKHNLVSGESSLETKLQTLEKIHSLSKELPSRNSYLIQLDFLPLLLGLIFRKVESEHFQEDPRFVEKALVCARKLLPFSDLGCLNMLKEESKLAYFIVLLEIGTNIVKSILCNFVEAISSSLATKEICVVIGENKMILQGIIHLINDNSNEVSEAGIKSISALGKLETGKENLIKEGVVHGLVSYILNAERLERRLSPMAMATLEQLLRLESGKDAVINHPNGVNAIVKMVFRVSDHAGSESAVNSLIMIICCGSIRAREEAICGGVLTQLLLLLQSQCSGRTKARARKLLKLLRSKACEDTKHVM